MCVWNKKYECIIIQWIHQPYQGKEGSTAHVFQRVWSHSRLYYSHCIAYESYLVLCFRFAMNSAKVVMLVNSLSPGLNQFSKDLINTIPIQETGRQEIADKKNICSNFIYNPYTINISLEIVFLNLVDITTSRVLF